MFDRVDYMNNYMKKKIFYFILIGVAIFVVFLTAIGDIDVRWFYSGGAMLIAGVLIHIIYKYFKADIIWKQGVEEMKNVQFPIKIAPPRSVAFFFLTLGIISVGAVLMMLEIEMHVIEKIIAGSILPFVFFTLGMKTPVFYFTQNFVKITPYFLYLFHIDRGYLISHKTIQHVKVSQVKGPYPYMYMLDIFYEKKKRKFYLNFYNLKQVAQIELLFKQGIKK